MEALRPYAAAFAVRFQTLLQYRAAALAGFATQCWWGGLKVMIYSAFYHHAARGHAPITLAQTITYTWLAQALLTLQPWVGDPDIAAAVRSGGVGYDRLRPVDTYAWWFVRAMAWMTARVVPRATLMFVVAAVVLPLLGLGEWAWRAPADTTHAGLFAVSLMLTILLGAAFTMLINICIAVTLTDRGVNMLATAFVILFSGNLIPLSFFPDWAQAALFVQPFAGMVDIPMRIYIGALNAGTALEGLALQASWTVVFVIAGRMWMSAAMNRLELQGG
jgi:ABC-2 type transport system permease protein